MRHQQQAEKEEQQRIKSLVLNLDNLSAARDRDRDPRLKDAEPESAGDLAFYAGPSTATLPAINANHYLGHYGKSGQQERGGKSKVQRGRQLQVSDLDF